MRKPGSVVDGHLSRMHVAVHLKPPVGTIGQIIVPVGVAADRVYRPPRLPWDVVSSYLAFPPLLPYADIKQRYISVALFLRSPSADVIRYPCPVQPGLSSCPKARDRLHQSQIALYRKKTLSSNRTCKIVKNHVYCQSTKGGVTHL